MMGYKPGDVVLFEGIVAVVLRRLSTWRYLIDVGDGKVVEVHWLDLESYGG